MKTGKRKLIVACFLFAFAFSKTETAYSQSASDSTQKTITTRNKKDTAAIIQYVLAENISEFYSPDTSFTGFQNYNPVYLQPYNYAYLGNIGTAHQSLVFYPMKKTGFDMGYHQFDLYTFQSEKIKYHNTTKPLTDLTFALGKKSEQFFKLTHTQNIRPNFNLGFDLQKISSDGLYAHQKTNDLALDLFSWYKTPNQRYNLLLAFVFNKIRVEENGGITSDILFEDDEINKLFKTRTTVDIHLKDAQNLWNKKNAFIQQSFDLGKKYEKQINDTTKIKMLFPQTRFGHSFTFQNGGYKYRDKTPDSTLYPITYFSIYSTLDSTHIEQYDNKLFWQFLGNKNRIGDSTVYNKNIFFVEFLHSIINIRQSPGYSFDTMLTDTAFQNSSLAFQFGTNPKAKTKLFYQLSAQYGLSGYNANDYLTNAAVGIKFSEKAGMVQFNIFSQQHNPAWIAQRYRSNHLWWDNNFDKIKITAVGFSYRNSKNNFEIGATTYSVINHLYWDTLAYPKQTAENISVTVISLKKNFTWKNLHFNNLVFVQKFSSKNYIHLPEFLSNHSLFYQNYFFKKALFAQIGFDVRYQDNYFADAYLPATGQFYLQDESSLSFYPVADFFLNLKIKRAKLFLKVENLNQRLPNNGYYSFLHYPMPDRIFKVGIQWKFYD